MEDYEFVFVAHRVLPRPPSACKTPQNGQVSIRNDFLPILAEDITHITTPKSMYSSKGYNSGEHTEPAKARQENNRAPYDLVTVENIMKQYTDNLLHALEGISGGLSHLESTTRHLETSLGELKMTDEINPNRSH